jgi:hypothetical protein
MNPDISNFITEVPIGIKNGANLYFTVSKAPRAIIENGLWYFNGSGFTLDASSSIFVIMDNGLAPLASSTFLSLQISDTGYSSTSPLYVNSVPYGDWLLVNSLILFCVVFLPVSALFSLLKLKR